MDYVPPTPEQLAAQQMLQMQWMRQQALQQQYWATQRGAEAERVWRESSRPVGVVLGIGLFVLAVFRILLAPLLWGTTPDSLAIAVCAPTLGAAIGGAVMAVGWLIVLRREPRTLLRVIALAGMLVSVGLALCGWSGVTSSNLSEAIGSHAFAWLEVGATALALAGSSLWRTGTIAVTAILGWIGFALMLVVCVANGDNGGGAVITFGMVPAATWGLAGVAVLGMRALRDALAGGMPSAVLVQR